MTRFGYLGPEGSYSDIALSLYAKPREAQITKVPIPHFSGLFDAIQAGSVDTIIVPFENAIEGHVSAVLDLFFGAKSLSAVAEIKLPIHHALMALAAVPLTDIKWVRSHPQALSQCQNYIRTHLPESVIEESQSTSYAAALTASGGDKSIGVIGPEGLASRYGLTLLATNVGDFPNNSTRFLVLSKSKTPAERTGDDKTSFVFSTLKDKAGGLVEILSEFAKRQINLTEIISRPTKGALGDYLFFVDCLGHTSDPEVREALIQVTQKSSLYRLLGTYPRWPD